MPIKTTTLWRNESRFFEKYYHELTGSKADSTAKEPWKKTGNVSPKIYNWYPFLKSNIEGWDRDLHNPYVIVENTSIWLNVGTITAADT